MRRVIPRPNRPTAPMPHRERRRVPDTTAHRNTERPEQPGRVAPPPHRSRMPEESRPVQLRVITDQPWDVPADVLVIPVAPDPTFDGPLGELDKRSGGELTALASFGE